MRAHAKVAALYTSSQADWSDCVVQPDERSQRQLEVSESENSLGIKELQKNQNENHKNPERIRKIRQTFPLSAD
jgi:hypothetical protein